MTDTAISPAAAADASKRYNYIGTALIALAFVGPSLLRVSGIGGTQSAAAVGEDLGRTLGSLALLMLISWLITRSRSELAKAKGRLVVGILLCLVVGNNIANAAREEDQAKQFLRDAIAFQQKHSSKFADLGARFDKVNVVQYLTPAALTSKDGIAAGRAALEGYQSLLSERNLLLQTYLAEYERFLAAIPPGDMREGAIAGMGDNKENTERLYRLLDTTQSAHATSIRAVFDWAAANLGRVSVQNGQFMFQTQAQQSELQALAAKLEEAEKAVQSAVEVAQAEQAKAAAKNEQNMREAKKLLGD